MPRYNYKCDKCNKGSTVSKPMSEYDTKEFCKDCKAELTRVYSFAVKTGDGFKG